MADDPFPLEGTPWFDPERWWVSPQNFSDEIQARMPERVAIHPPSVENSNEPGK